MGAKVTVRAVTENGIDLIKHEERFVGHIYICPAGWPTIGYGHVVKDNERERFTHGITEEEGDVLLANDIKRYELSVCHLITMPLDDGMYNALVSFTFNLGGGALQRSTLRQKLNRKEYADAADAFLAWKWGGRPLRVLPGLVKRRATERHLFLTGELMWFG